MAVFYNYQGDYILCLYSHHHKPLYSNIYSTYLPNIVFFLLLLNMQKDNLHGCLGLDLDIATLAVLKQCHDQILLKAIYNLAQHGKSSLAFGEQPLQMISYCIHKQHFEEQFLTHIGEKNVL